MTQLLKDKLWKDANSATCIRHDNKCYKVVAINDHNEDKLLKVIQYDLPIKSISLEQDGDNSYKCVILAVISPNSTLPVICHVERYMTDEETQKINEFVAVFSETTLNKNDGQDYHEIHPDGRLACGVKDGIPYEEVLDENGAVTYTVMVRDNCLVGMVFNDDCYAFVEVGDDKEHQDEIREIRGKTEFVNNIRDEGDEGKTDDEIICENAYNELACPRWGMTW